MNENKFEKETHRQHTKPTTLTPIRIDAKEATMAWPALQMDVDYFQSFLDDQEIEESDKAELIDTLWKFIVTFVDLGYGIEPTQQALSDKHLDRAKNMIADTDAAKARFLTGKFNHEKETQATREGADA